MSASSSDGGQDLKMVESDITFKEAGRETVLGRGRSFGIVYERVLTNYHKVVIKRIPLSDVSIDSEVIDAEESREWMAMKDLKHDNVLKLYSYHNIEDVM